MQHLANRLKSKSRVTMFAWPNLTAPLGQHLKAGLSQSFLRGMKGGEKETNAFSAHSLWQQQECGNPLRLLQHLGVALSCGFVWLVGRCQQMETKVLSLNKRHQLLSLLIVNGSYGELRKQGALYNWHTKGNFLENKNEAWRSSPMKKNTTEPKEVTQVTKPCKPHVEYLFGVFQPLFWEPFDLWFFHFIWVNIFNRTVF